jgi:hypothetical protein
MRRAELESLAVPCPRMRFEELLDLTAECLQLHPRTGWAVANAGLATWRITADLKEANGHGTDATAAQYLRMA